MTGLHREIWQKGETWAFHCFIMVHNFKYHPLSHQSINTCRYTWEGCSSQEVEIQQAFSTPSNPAEDGHIRGQVRTIIHINSCCMCRGTENGNVHILLIRFTQIFLWKQWFILIFFLNTIIYHLKTMSTKLFPYKVYKGTVQWEIVFMSLLWEFCFSSDLTGLLHSQILQRATGRTLFSGILWVLLTVIRL